MGTTETIKNSNKILESEKVVYPRSTEHRKFIPLHPINSSLNKDLVSK